MDLQGLKCFPSVKKISPEKKTNLWAIQSLLEANQKHWHSHRGGEESMGKMISAWGCCFAWQENGFWVAASKMLDSPPASELIKCCATLMTKKQTPQQWWEQHGPKSRLHLTPCGLSGKVEQGKAMGCSCWFVWMKPSAEAIIECDGRWDGHGGLAEPLPALLSFW